MILLPEKLDSQPEGRPTEPERLPSPEGQPVNRANQESADESLYLTGRPTLKRFLRFVKNNAVRPADEGTLTDEWEAA